MEGELRTQPLGLNQEKHDRVYKNENENENENQTD